MQNAPEECVSTVGRERFEIFYGGFFESIVRKRHGRLPVFVCGDIINACRSQSGNDF